MTSKLKKITCSIVIPLLILACYSVCYSQQVSQIVNYNAEYTPFGDGIQKEYAFPKNVDPDNHFQIVFTFDLTPEQIEADVTGTMTFDQENGTIQLRGKDGNLQSKGGLTLKGVVKIAFVIESVPYLTLEPTLLVAVLAINQLVDFPLPVKNEVVVFEPGGLDLSQLLSELIPIGSLTVNPYQTWDESEPFSTLLLDDDVVVRGGIRKLVRAELTAVEVAQLILTALTAIPPSLSKPAATIVEKGIGNAAISANLGFLSTATLSGESITVNGVKITRENQTIKAPGLDMSQNSYTVNSSYNEKFTYKLDLAATSDVTLEFNPLGIPIWNYEKVIGELPITPIVSEQEVDLNFTSNQTTFPIAQTSTVQSPITVNSIPHQDLTLGGSSQTVDVAPYFSSENNLTYEVESNPSSIATASVSGSGSRVTVRPVAAGVATVVVTASDTVTGLTAVQTISVSVRQTGVVIVRPTNTDPIWNPSTDSYPRAERLRVGVSVIVDELAPGKTLRVRSKPGTGTNDTIIELIGNGLTGIITDGDRQANGFTWWKIEWDSVNLEGWSAEVVPHASGGDPVQVIFRRLPDLEIRALNVDNDEVSPGEEIELDVEIYNNGPGESDETEVTFYYHSGWRNDDLEELREERDLRRVGKLRVPSLRQRRSTTLTHRVNAPMELDRYYFGAHLPYNIHPSDNTDHLDEDEAKDNNLAREERVRVVGSPDYIIESIRLSNNRTTLDPGESFTLRATVRNQGQGEPTSSADLDYYRSSDARISTSDRWVGDDSVSRLDTDETGNESVSLTAPTEPGVYYYGACVSDVRNESNDNNNCSAAVAITVRPTTTPVEITGSPDLVVSLSSTSNNSLVDPNGSINLVATVRNQGDADASNSTTVRYYVSSDAAISSDDQLIATDSVRSLNQGSSGDEDHGVRAPSQPGQYYYYAYVDSVTDEDETSNNYSNFVTINVRGADLVVESVSVDLLGQIGSINPNGEFTLNATIRNQGTGTAAATTARYFISTDQTFSELDDSEVQSAIISALNTGASTNAQSTTIRSPYTSGIFYCFVCIDTLSNEIDADNNCSDPIQITIRNVAPRAKGTIPAQTLNVGTSKSLNVSENFVDDNRDTLTYSANSSDNSIATASVFGSQVTITPKRAGSATITLTANDDTLTATQTFTITVLQQNRAPVAVGTIAAQTLTIGDSPIKIDVSSNFRDVDKDTLTYTATSNKGHIATATVSGTQITIAPIGEGNATITVTASDGKLSTTQTISVSVMKSNRAPVAVGTISARTLTVGDSAITIFISGSFNDLDNDTLTYVANSSNTSVVRVSVSGSQITITPISAGNATITITANDGELTASQTISVTVTAAPVANRAPVTVGAISARTLTVGDSAVVIDVSGNFNDPDDDDLTYSANSSNTSVATTSVSGSIVTITPVSAGNATITVTASDDESTATQTISVTVTAAPVANRAPVTVGAISARTLTVGDSAVVIDVSGNFNDPDNDTLTYSVNSNNTSVVSVNVSGSQITITPVGVGTATITITANDGELTATQTISITVTAAPVVNRAPFTVGAISSRTLTEGDSSIQIDVSGNFQDPDNDTLTYSVNSNNTSVATASVSGSQITITPVGVGNATITITASDDAFTATQTISVTVTAAPVANSAPFTVGAISSRTLTVGDSAIVLDVSGNFNDPDNDTLTYSVNSNNTSVATTSVSGSQVTITPVAAGSATITVTASDGKLTATQNISIVVTNVPVPNRAPVTVGTISSRTLTVGGSPAVLNVLSNFEDPDEDNLSFTTTSSDTNVASVNVSGARVTITPMAAGSTTITVTASDGEFTATQTISITVTETPVANRAPVTVGSILSQELTVGGSSSVIDVVSNFSDPDGNSITYSATSSDVAIVSVTVSNSQVTITPVSAGNATITVTASDGSLTATQTISVLVATAITEETWMPDANLRAKVRSALGLQEGDALTQQKIISLTRLVSSQDQIGDLTGMEHAVNLQHLSLGANQISDISPLENLTALTSLSLWRTQISDITALQNLTALTSINLGENQISDITAFQNLTALSSISIRENQISNITALENLINMTSLSIGGNLISDITPLENLTGLTSLSLGTSSGQVGNLISDLSPLENLTGLTSLDLSRNQISDISSLENLTALTNLSLFSNQISDVSPLEDLTILTSLSLEYNQLSNITPLGNLTALTGLRLRGNQISDVSPLENLTTLTSLLLSQNPVTDYAPLRRLQAKTTQTISIDIDITVDPNPPETNNPPVTVGSISSRTLTVGDSPVVVDISSNFEDADDDNLRYSATSDKTGIVSLSLSGSQVTITAVGAGIALITVSASDAKATARLRFSVTVVVPNRTPVAVSSISSRTITVGGSSEVVDVSGNFNDPDDDNLSYTAISSDTSKATVSVSNSEVTISPVSAGSATITVTASDGKLTATQTISVTVTAAPVPNRAPVTVGSIPDQTFIYPKLSEVVDVSSNFEDPDDDNLSYSAASSDTSVVSVSVSGTQVTITRVGVGSATVTVTASDGELTASQTISVTVNANRAPIVVGPISSYGLLVGGRSARVDGSSHFNDPDNNTLTYTASSSDTDVATVSVSGRYISITPVLVGSATITVTASDGELTATKTSSVTVTTAPGANRAPIVVGTIPAQTLLFGGSPVTVDVSSNFSDPDNHTLTYTVTSSSTSVATVSVSGSQVTITAVASGSATITVTASDGELTVSQTISVTVTNRAPVAVGTIDDQTLTVGGSSATIDVSGNFNDPDNDTLTYTASSSNTSVATLSMSGSEITITAAGKGSATITVTASDGELTVSQTISVTVTNRAPVAVGTINDQTLTVGGSSATIDVSDNFNDPDNDTLTYTVSSNDTSIATVSVSGSEVTITPVAAGSATITVTASDEILTAKQTISVTVDALTGQDLVPDSKLRAKLLNALGLQTDDELTAETLNTLTSLNVARSSITDITGLKHATNLTTLSLAQNKIGAISEIENLTNLTSLVLSETGISDISALEALTNLTSLNISSNNINELTPLEELTNLNRLVLGSTNTSDLSSLADLINLSSLSLFSNSISDISSLDKLTKLTTLDLSVNSISDISSLDKLTELTWLNLQRNQITDVSPLEDLTSLTTLYLSGNSITDYAPLRRLQAKTTQTITIDVDITTDPNNAPSAQATPTETALLPNFPNPFNPETWIPYQLAKPADVALTFYNVQGVVVRQLSLGHRVAGVYYSRSRAAHWDGKNNLGEKVAAGIYFVKFKAGDWTKIRKMLIRK